MHRRPIQELEDFLKGENIPKVSHFLDLKEGRPDIFKRSIEEARKVNGLFLELGVMSGGTINQISALVPDKTVYGFDSFKGISEDFSEIHTKGKWYHGIPKVNENVKLIIGYYQDTLEPFLQNHKEKIAFLHGSSSIYSSTVYYLETLYKYDMFQIGTVVQFDTIFYVEGDYWYEDEYKAWKEFKEKYDIKTEYIAWAGYCHCSYRITGLNNR